MKGKYYIPFIENMKKIDIYFLFSLYDLAEYNVDTKNYDTVRYTTQESLALLLGISVSKLKRIISNSAYDEYFKVDTKNKIITINNDFHKSKSKEEKKPFVSVSAGEVRILRKYKEHNELLPKYYLYIKYYCGYNKKKHYIDTTAKQVLSAIGYCSNSSYLSLLPTYNKILISCGLIRIDSYRDNLGHLRNKYYVNT